ncbi:MAG TPA: glycosyltransferase family 4 protein [Candidatus Kapabacteria bacterium]|nr:glycosyltransferase family 4 protein [Candidatus Kapabacteria bacterium]
MKYVFFCPSYGFGGLEMQMVRKAADANERGDSALLVTAPGAKMAEYAESLGVAVRTVSVRIDYVDIAAAVKLGSILQKERADACIVGITRHLSLAILAKKLFRLHTSVSLFQQMISGLRKIDPFHNWVYRNLDTAIVPTRLMVDLLASSTTFPRENIRLVPYGIHLDECSARGDDRVGAREMFGIPRGAFVIGQTARFEPLKDQETTIRAFAEAEIPNSLLVLAGEGNHEYRAKMHELVSELGIVESVRFIPFTHDFGALLACLDIYVMSSLCETFSLALIQAMAAGKPVIGTNAGGTPEAITHYENGLLFEPRDVRTLASHLKLLFDETEFSERLGAQAALDARSRYEHHKVNNEFFSACVQSRAVASTSRPADVVPHGGMALRSE